MINLVPPPPRYLLKMPDKWLNSKQGIAAKRRIQETLSARIASGELSGFEGEAFEGGENDNDQLGKVDEMRSAESRQQENR